MFRKMGQRFSELRRRFMWGRNGVDRLNLFLVILSVALSVISFALCLLGPVPALIGAVLNCLAYVLLIWYLFRLFSRNLEARALENRRYLVWRSRITDRKNRYFRCPNCRQAVRVPKGHGKVCVICPRCGEKFIKKT